MASSILLLIVGCASGCTFAASEQWDIVGSRDSRVLDYRKGWPASVGLSLKVNESRRFGSSFDGGVGFLEDPVDLAVDGSGNIYVLDKGLKSIVVFDSGGKYARSFGREGQGPGEFVRPTHIAIAGNSVVVYDGARKRFVFSDLEGQFESEAKNELGAVLSLSAWPAFLVVSTVQTNGAQEEFRNSIAITSVRVADGTITEVARFPVRLIQLRPNRVGSSFAGGFSLGMARTGRRTPSYAVGGVGSIVVFPGNGPEIAEFGADGKVRWIVRMPLGRVPIDRSEIEQWVRPMKRGKTLRESDLIVPEYAPSFSHINTDGEGNIFAFPPRRDGQSLSNTELPVYVFARDGEFRGEVRITTHEWQAAWGRYIYSIEWSDEIGEMEVVQRQLVEAPSRLD